MYFLLNLELMCCWGDLQALQVMKINRGEKQSRTALVTDVKYSMVFNATVCIAELHEQNIEVSLKILRRIGNMSDGSWLRIVA